MRARTALVEQGAQLPVAAFERRQENALLRIVCACRLQGRAVARKAALLAGNRALHLAVFQLPAIAALVVFVQPAAQCLGSQTQDPVAARAAAFVLTQQQVDQSAIVGAERIVIRRTVAALDQAGQVAAVIRPGLGVCQDIAARVERGQAAQAGKDPAQAVLQFLVELTLAWRRAAVLAQYRHAGLSLQLHA
ncbi:hypothetical protein D9M68_658110 [compost metagenome]